MFAPQLPDLPALRMLPQVTRVEISIDDRGGVSLQKFTSRRPMLQVTINAVDEPQRLRLALDMLYDLLTRQTYDGRDD